MWGYVKFSKNFRQDCRTWKVVKDSARANLDEELLRSHSYQGNHGVTQNPYQKYNIFNILKPTIYVMHHQFNIQQL